MNCKNRIFIILRNSSPVFIGIGNTKLIKDILVIHKGNGFDLLGKEIELSMISILVNHTLEVLGSIKTMLFYQALSSLLHKDTQIQSGYCLHSSRTEPFDVITSLYQ